MTLNARWPSARGGGDLIRRGVLTSLCAIALIAGCSDYPLSPRDQQLLAQAKGKWANNGSLDYTVEARILCFCPGHLAVWTRLTVRDGNVVAADPLETPPPGSEPDLTGWLTVEEEFERLTRPPDILEEIEVRFDAELGYPTYIRADCGPNVQDCGSVHEMRNLQRTTTPAPRS
jgi:hypothetical protein